MQDSPMVFGAWVGTALTSLLKDNCVRVPSIRRAQIAMYEFTFREPWKQPLSSSHAPIF